MATTLHVTIRGRVQGVGFRYATYREANALGLTGWVRNAYDGSVEAEFAGPKESLDLMLGWCREGPPYARVSDVEVEWRDSDSKYVRFEIRG
ncbi:MAG: acylphosphatase [Candidatus Hydrogenedentes bacterium]|nr:acylphosphatase [Candidatus Hydrogenedentota bacterium]